MLQKKMGHILKKKKSSHHCQTSDVHRSESDNTIVRKSHTYRTTAVWWSVH